MPMLVTKLKTGHSQIFVPSNETFFYNVCLKSVSNLHDVFFVPPHMKLLCGLASNFVNGDGGGGFGSCRKTRKSRYPMYWEGRQVVCHVIKGWRAAMLIFARRRESFCKLLTLVAPRRACRICLVCLQGGHCILLSICLGTSASAACRLKV